MQRQNTVMRGVIPVLCAAMLWGTTGTLQTMLPDTKDPLVVGAFRLIFGALTLVGVAAMSAHTRAAFKHLPLGHIVAAGVAIGAYNMLFFAGVLKAGVGIGTAITIGSAPIWVTVILYIRHRHLPRPIQLLGQALCIFGAILLVAPQGHISVPLAGVMLALASGLSYALYSLVSSNMPGDIPSNTQAAATFCVAAFVTLPVVLIAPVAWVATSAALVPLAILGVVSTGLAYALYTWGLRSVSAPSAVTLALAEPLTAWVLALVVVGETVTLVSGMGAASLFVGIAVVSLNSR